MLKFLKLKISSVNETPKNRKKPRSCIFKWKNQHQDVQSSRVLITVKIIMK